MKNRLSTRAISARGFLPTGLPGFRLTQFTISQSARLRNKMASGSESQQMLGFWRLSSLALAVATGIACTAVGCHSAPNPDTTNTLFVRNAHSMFYDDDHRAVILFGGADATHVCGDTWQWNAKKKAWHFVTADGPDPQDFCGGSV